MAEHERKSLDIKSKKKVADLTKIINLLPDDNEIYNEETPDAPMQNRRSQSGFFKENKI